MFNNTFRDMLFIMVFGYAFMVFMMLPFLNPPTLKDEVKPPGNMIVVMEWPPGNVDVDLWVIGPGEVQAVGYSRQSGPLWNLLRDDLGNSADPTPSNFENAFTRGIPPGEYIINIHCYRCLHGDVPVSIEVSVKTPSRIRVIAFTEVIVRPREEVTALRFVVDKNGKIIRNSINHRYQPLRSRKSISPPEHEQ